MFFAKKKNENANYLIVGLGNPEPEYSKTRHNMGFDTINKLAEKYDIKINKSKFKSIYGTGAIEGTKVILCKPQTYMNLSGDAILPISKFYKIPIEKIIVIYDDIDIEIGTIKIRKKGGSGTHNGMKSIVHTMNSEEFPRIRIGTGFCENKENLVDYVIKKVSNEEYEKLKKGIDLAVDAISEIMKNGIDVTMNKFN